MHGVILESFVMFDHQCWLKVPCSAKPYYEINAQKNINIKLPLTSNLLFDDS